MRHRGQYAFIVSPSREYVQSDRLLSLIDFEIANENDIRNERMFKHRKSPHKSIINRFAIGYYKS